MKTAFFTALFLLGTAASFAYADEGMDEFELSRTFVNVPQLGLNGSGAAVILGAAAILLVVGLLAIFTMITVATGGSAESQYANYYNKNDFYENYDQAYANAQYDQYRSAQNGFFDGMNIVQWISMLQDVYEKFDYNDLDCQKRLICEVMREPEYYGTVAQKFKTGFQYAKYLEVLDLPDDMRELLDEYMDANSRADQQKTCEEFFTCPYSIKDSMKRNIADSNNL